MRILHLFFSVSAVIWGVSGIVYRIVMSKKYSVRFLEVETSKLYDLAFWVIVIPFLILGAIIMLL